MSQAKKRYDFWRTDPAFDDATKAELEAIADDPNQIEDRFYQDLQFGTAGLRGVLGAGTNRMNRYTVARAAAGFAKVIAGEGPRACRRGMVICYDSRHRSSEFAKITALIFCMAGIRVYLSDQLRPVPMLSFAIRHLQAAGGVMITASHNPPQYNGFKAYGQDGGQLPPEAAAAVSHVMETIENPAKVEAMDETHARAQGLLSDLGQSLDDAYNAMLLKLRIDLDCVARQKDMKIVYTPLHGAGYRPVCRILGDMGFENLIIVSEQAEPDPDFPTVASPNPEERSALDLAIRKADEEKADLVIATDPDGDRTGLAVRTAAGQYQVLSGNQIGLLLMDYILAAHRQKGTLPDNSFVVMSIVSTKLAHRVARDHQVTLHECLTGFKYIAEKIMKLDEQGDEHFMFGFEESLGFLAGTSVRDKDAVVTSMFIAEMAAAARSQGQTLHDRLQALYQKHGFAAEKTLSFSSEGKAGLEKIAAVMQTLRREKGKAFPELPLRALRDFETLQRHHLDPPTSEPMDFDRSNVLLYEMEGLDWFAVRPSGTEPKIKVYFGLHRQDEKEARRALQHVQSIVEAKVRQGL